MDNDKWITVKEAARISGYNIEYIRELARDNKVASQKFGWSWMIDKESLEQYLKERRES